MNQKAILPEIELFRLKDEVVEYVRNVARLVSVLARGWNGARGYEHDRVCQFRVGQRPSTD